ncbi:MAG: hypothetical protein NTV63_04090 [Candidatus Woesearchaeota archaeon]|nr:hypothetical protein [Candidatus Woesearchaeota archaeon]
MNKFKKGLVSLIAAATICAGGVFSQPAHTIKSEQQDVPYETIEETLGGFTGGWSNESEMTPEEKESFGRYTKAFETFMTPELLIELTKNYSDMEKLNLTLSDGDKKNGEFINGKETVYFINNGKESPLVCKIEDDKGNFYYGFSNLSKCLSDGIEKQVHDTASRKTEEEFSKLECACNGGVNFNYNFARALINGEGLYKPRLDSIVSAIELATTDATGLQRKNALLKLSDGIYSYPANYEINDERTFRLYTGDDVNIAMRMDTGYFDAQKKVFCGHISFYNKTDNTNKFKQKISAANYTYTGQEGQIHFNLAKDIMECATQEYLERHPTEDFTTNSPKAE